MVGVLPGSAGQSPPCPLGSAGSGWPPVSDSCSSSGVQPVGGLGPAVVVPAS